MKIYSITSAAYPQINRKVNVSKHPYDKNYVAFKGGSQKAFMSEIRAIINNKEIPQWQREIRDYIIRIDGLTALVPEGIENTFVEYPIIKNFNLKFFDKIMSVQVDELGTTIGTKEEDILHSHSLQKKIYIPHGLNSLLMGGDNGIMVTDIVDGQPSNITKYRYDGGKELFAKDGIIYFYNSKNRPISASKESVANNGIFYDIHYDKDGNYQKTLFYDRMDNILKEESKSVDTYYKNNRLYCTVNSDNQVCDPKGYKIFTL